MANTIFTIGHSNHTWETFAALLKRHAVQVLVDTRTTPKSRYAPYAALSSLPSLLDGEGMRYAYLGDALGGKPSDASSYDAKGRPDYGEMRKQESFQAGMDELVKLGGEATVALMCAEEDPSRCHRRLLIEPALLERGLEVRHIRGDGSVQGSEQLANNRAYRKQLQGVLPTA